MDVQVPMLSSPTHVSPGKSQAPVPRMIGPTLISGTAATACLSCSILMQQLLFPPLLSVPEHFAAVSVGVQEKLNLKSGIVFKFHIQEATIIMNV